jgi:hypothetical protein
MNTRWWRAVLFSLFAVPAAAQIREIPLPFPDTTRFRVQFVDEMHGWVSSMNGNILHTSDGGAHWEVFRSPYPTPLITEIQFSSRNYGILWASPDLPEYTGRLYHTTNAGKDWRQVPMLDSVYISTQDDFNYQHASRQVYSIKEGQILYSGWRDRRAGYEHIIAWTSDGGTTWTTTRPPADGQLLPFNLNRWGWFDRAYDSPDPDMYPYCSFSLSTDCGVSWKGMRGWDPVLGTRCEFWDSLRGIMYTDPWYAGIFPATRESDSGSYLTFDGGRTWEEWYHVWHLFQSVLIGDSALYGIEMRKRVSWEERESGALVRYLRKDPEKWREAVVPGIFTAMT